jgi:hypothetical protein
VRARHHAHRSGGTATARLHPAGKPGAEGDGQERADAVPQSAVHDVSNRTATSDDGGGGGEDGHGEQGDEDDGHDDDDDDADDEEDGLCCFSVKKVINTL